MIFEWHDACIIGQVGEAPVMAARLFGEFAPLFDLSGAGRSRDG
jgi:hypothetical protein